jgi:phospholipase/lecithinase/hemolysin
MRQFKILGTALAAALLVAACGGGGGDGNQAPAVSYSAVVSFGDSLSDAGSYKVGPILASGGGMFTVNGITGAIGADPAPSYNWAQLVSAAAIGKVSCAAHTGGFGVARSALVAGCTNYAQGGARVSDPTGPGNLGLTETVFNAAMTEPVTTQIANYAADGGSFTGRELVTVLAGANDLFGATDKLKAAATAAGAAAGNAAFVQSLVSQLAAGATDPAAAAAAILAAVVALPAGSSSQVLVGTAVGTAAVQAGNSAVASAGVYGPMVVTATTTATAAGAAAGATYAATTGAATAVADMVGAATSLVTAIKGMISQGAKRVLVVNIPDVSQTPMATASPTTQPLVLALTQAFNATLQAGLATTSEVVFVDAFAENRRQLANPAHYALTNVTTVACDLTSPKNVLATAGHADGSSLVCDASNLVAGDTSHYMFADNVHPTPYGHKLLAQYATKAMVIAGWL